MNSPSEILQIENLQQYLLHKNGNYLYKLPFRGGWAVLKQYQGSRSNVRYMKKTFTNYLYSNKSSFMPRGRRNTELECIHLWRKAGIRVFDTYEEVVIEGMAPEDCLLFEYVDAPRFVTYFADKNVPVDQRLAMWRRFLPVWHSRHALAIQRREPKLVHENGDLKHVMILGNGEFLFFDFEMVFRSKARVEEAVAREILAYLRSLCKTVGKELWPVFMEETVAHYPDRRLLASAHRYFFRNPNPILRMARFFDRTIKPGSWKPFSKYNVTRKLHDLLQEAPGRP